MRGIGAGVGCGVSTAAIGDAVIGTGVGGWIGINGDGAMGALVIITGCTGAKVGP